MHETDNASSQDMGYPHRNIVKLIKHRRKKCKFLIISDIDHVGKITGTEDILKSTTVPLLIDLSDTTAVNTGPVFELLSSENASQPCVDESLQQSIFTLYPMKDEIGDAADIRNDNAINGISGENIEETEAGSRYKFLFKLNEGFSLQFNPCMDCSLHQRALLSGRKDTLVTKVKLPGVSDTRFDSLLYHGPLCSDDKNSAYGELLLARSRNLNSGVYEDMRSRYIEAVLSEDAAIMNRYLNQDTVPWISKFADIEKEILLHKSLLDLLRPDELIYRWVAARYYFFQAFSWYENALLVVNPERTIRLNKALKLIEQSLEYKPDSPAAFLLKSQVLDILQD